MQIRLIKPGILSTVQDLGRWNYLAQAVPVSGVMDSLSARIANKAIGNEDDAAVIEFTYASASFKAETDLLIAYAGDGAICSINSANLPAERPVFIPAGKVISLIQNLLGSRTYLAIAGGWNVPEIMGSKSTYLTAAFGGFEGRKLQPADVLSGTNNFSITTKNIFSALKSDQVNFPSWSLARQVFLPENKREIRVVPAPEFTWFAGRSICDFLSLPYRLSLRSNRMGYHLEGPLISRSVKKELLSTAVTPGTIQVTGNGSLVLLMADCQTTGGYPRMAQVAAVDLPLCGQLNPGDEIFFKEICKHEAEMLYLERESELKKLSVTLKYKFC